MRYKIEVMYTYGWDDAGWTDEVDGMETPTRFQSIADAQTALDKFFDDVKAAVVSGNIDTEEVRGDYRIAPMNI
jgi:hypothetical protein